MSRAGTVALALLLVGAALVTAGPAAAQTATTIDTDGDRVRLSAGLNQTVSGTTDLAPGTTVLVRLQSADASSPFLKQQSATVTEDGRFAASYDMSDVAPDTAFEVSVRHDGESLATANGTVTPCTEGCTTPTESTPDGSRWVEIDHDGDQFTPGAAPGRVVSGETDLDPGTELTVRLRSANASAPFLVQQPATVTDGGRFRTTVDLGSVPAGTGFELTVHTGGETLLETGGRVVECTDDCTVSTATPGEDEYVMRVDAVDTDGPDISSISEGVVGKTVSIHVAVGNRSNASVAIGGPEVNYRLNATVRDGNDDGRVLLRLHTDAAGGDSTTLTARDDADTVSIRSETSLAEPGLDPASYDMALFPSETPTGDSVAEGTLVLHAGGEDDALPASSQPDGSSGEPELGLRDTIVMAQSGQQTTLELVMGTHNTATVAIGSPEQGVVLNATVEDGDGDGTVDLLLDTTAVGDDDQPALTTAQDDDSVTVTTERAESALGPGDYDIDVYAGTDPSGAPDDIGTLALQGSLTNGTDTTPPTDTNATGPSSAVLGSGALAVGGVLAIAGLGLALGLFRD